MLLAQSVEAVEKEGRNDGRRGGRKGRKEGWKEWREGGRGEGGRKEGSQSIGILPSRCTPRIVDVKVYLRREMCDGWRPGHN